MSLPLYGTRLNIEDSNGNILGGVMWAYQEVNLYYHDFNGAAKIHLALALTDANEYTDIFLFTMSNGVRVYFRYNLIDNGNNYYNLRFSYVFTKSDDTPIFEKGVYFVQQAYNPQHSYRPFMNCEQFIATTSYTTNPAIAGDEAASVSIAGALYWEKPAVVSLVELTGSMSVTDISRGGWEWTSSATMNGNEFDTFKTGIIGGGDGTDPFTDNPAPEDEPDPSTPGGSDKPSADGGDPVDFPGLPTTNIIQTGLITVYAPNNTQLRSLATVLWGNDFEQSIKKILNDPFDGIIGLALLPVAPHTSGSEDCKIGNFNTQVNMALVDQQYMTIDCGTLQIRESWHNALDYSPATKLDIYIPFVGFKRLNTEDCMGKTLALKYNIDILSGSGIAMLKCGDKVLYTYPCKITYDVPLTGSNKAALYTGMINVAMSAIHGAAVGGAVGAAGGAATSALQTATSKQSDIDRSGSITSNTGVLGDFTPYVVLHRPIQSMPAKFRDIKGYQSNITTLLKSLSGYTEVDYVHLSIPGATDAELSEIESLLKSGVLI